MATVVTPAGAGKRPPVRFVRLGGVAFRVNLRVLALLGIALGALIALGGWGMMLGSFRLPLSDVIAALTGSGSEDARFIVRDLRLPRVLVAALVGALLAMSGAIFQGLVRNPLVSPDIVGVNAGAAFAAVFWIASHQPLEALPVVAFAGAAVAGASVYLLSWRGHVSGARLILIGIGVNALLTAGTTLLIVRSDINDASRAVLWMTGSVYASSWSDVRVLTVSLAVLGPLSVGLIWSLRVIQTGDLTARAVGMELERTRLALILAGCILSAIAVSIAGPVGFVALTAPHMARMLAGPMSGAVLLFTGALGALLALGADLVGQHALPVSLPVGVITAAVGAPYFLFLLYRVNARL